MLDIQVFKVIDFKKGISSEYVKRQNMALYKQGKAFTDIDLNKNPQLLYMVLDLEEAIRKNTDIVNKYINDLNKKAQGLNYEALIQLKIKSLSVHKELQYKFKKFDTEADKYSLEFGYDSAYLYTLVRVYGERVQALENLFDDKLNSNIL